MSNNLAEPIQGRDSDCPRYEFSPGLPAVLSFAVPGLGQAYAGNPFAGFLWLLTTLLGYIPFILPGLVLHLLAVATACFRPIGSRDSSAG